MLGITGSSPVARPLTRLSIPERLEQAGRRRVVRERAKGQPWACLRHGADAGIPARRGRPSRPAADQNADAFSQGVRPDGPLLAQCLADVCASLSLFPNLSLLPLNLVNHELDVVKLGHSALLRRRPLLNNRCDRLARVNEPRETADVRVAVLFALRRRPAWSSVFFVRRSSAAKRPRSAPREAATLSVRPAATNGGRSTRVTIQLRLYAAPKEGA